MAIKLSKEIGLNWKEFGIEDEVLLISEQAKEMETTNILASGTVNNEISATLHLKLSVLKIEN